MPMDQGIYQHARAGHGGRCCADGQRWVRRTRVRLVEFRLACGGGDGGAGTGKHVTGPITRLSEASGVTVTAALVSATEEKAVAAQPIGSVASAPTISRMVGRIPPAVSVPAARRRVVVRYRSALCPGPVARQ